MYLLAKYNTQTSFRFPMVKRGVADFAASADWTPATGDTKISKDGGSFANTTNNPSAVAGTGSIGWTLTVTAAELSAAEVNIQIVDSATKAVEDQWLTVYTYGHASAKIPADLSDTVRLGMTALPNASAAASGGLPTVDASNAVKVQSGTGSNQISLSSGLVTLAATGLDNVVTAEPVSVPAYGGTLKGAISWLLALARNKITQTNTTQTLRNDADNANIATASVSDDGTTFTRAEWA